MEQNNEAHGYYKNIIEGYQNHNEALFEHAVRCWMFLGLQNPFTENTPEYEAYFQMQRCFNLWQMGDADMKVNYKRLLAYSKDFAELNIPNPYIYVEPPKKVEKPVKVKQEKKVPEIPKPVVKKEEEEVVKEYVFGVPEPHEEVKKGFFARLFKRGDKK